MLNEKYSIIDISKSVNFVDCDMVRDLLELSDYIFDIDINTVYMEIKKKLVHELVPAYIIRSSK